MDDVSDALAQSQLDLLYKLGLLEQPAGEENDPHAFLNRLPPPATPGTPGVGVDEHAFRPRSGSAFSLQQSGGEKASYVEQQAAREYAAVRPYTPVTRSVVAPRQPADSILRRVPVALPSPLSMTGRVPLTPLSDYAGERSARVRDNQEDEKMSASSRVKCKQRWFTAWKRAVEARWRDERIQAMGRRIVKRKILRRWLESVHASQVIEARTLQLMRFKALRALQRWKVWSGRRGHVSALTHSNAWRFTMVNTLRKRRVWSRWKHFIKWHHRYRRKLDAANALHWERVARTAWQALLLNAFRGRRRRATLARCIEGIRGVLVARGHLGREVERRRHAVNQIRKKEVFRRWWLFTVDRQHEQRKTWRVRMIVTRGKFFQSWHSAMQYARRIDALRCQVIGRSRRDHFHAWVATAVAMRMSRSSVLWQPQPLCSSLFRRWSMWAIDSARFRFATIEVHRRRVQRALRQMCLWTEVHKSISNLRRKGISFHRRRLLLRVWEQGLIVHHLQRQAQASCSRQIRAFGKKRAFSAWSGLWTTRVQSRTRAQAALVMAFTSVLRRSWRRWFSHLSARRKHKLELASAENHARHHKLIIGLVAFSRLVDRRSHHARTCRTIRERQRRELKRLCFLAWRRHVQTKNRHARFLSVFQNRTDQAKSIWNPLRRNWNRWAGYTRQCQMVRWLLGRHACNAKRRVFVAWRTRFLSLNALAQYMLNAEVSLMNAMFSNWRRRASHWSKKRDLSLLAQHVQKRKSSLKILSAWFKFACGTRRRQKRGEHALLTSQRLKLWHQYFARWRGQFLLRHHVRLTMKRSIEDWLRLCIQWWRHAASQQRKIKKKMQYYHHVHSVHPQTSPFRRMWQHWKYWTGVRKQVYVLAARQTTALGRRCFSAWKTFSLARLVLRSWQKISLITASTGNDLGKRRRLLRTARNRRLQRAILMSWVGVVTRSKLERERRASCRHRMLQDVQREQRNRERARGNHLRFWFHRWVRSRYWRMRLAKRHHRNKIFVQVFQALWRYSIHCKQERVLSEARRTMDQLSFHNPRHGSYKEMSLSSRRPTRNPTIHLTVSNKLSATPNISRGDKPAMVRRMHDPSTHDSYSRSLRQRHIPDQPIKRILSKADSRISTTRTPKKFQIDANRIRLVSDDRRSFKHDESREHMGTNNGTIALAETTRVPKASRSLRPEHVDLPHFDTDVEPTPAQSLLLETVTNTSRSGELPSSNKPVTSRQADHYITRDPVRIPPADDLLGSEAISLESIAVMNPYSPTTRSPRAEDIGAHPDFRAHEKEKELVKTVDISISLPGTSDQNVNRMERGNVRSAQTRQFPSNHDPSNRRLTKQHAHGYEKNRRREVNFKGDLFRRGEHESDIAELLDIPPPRVSAGSTVQRVLEGMKSGQTDRVCVDPEKVVSGIVEAYAGRINSTRVAASLYQICFSMLRDLGLFENGYFVIAMERALHGEANASSAEPVKAMRSFLLIFLSSHPSYMEESNKSGSQDSPTKSQDPFSWLVFFHLPRRIGAATVMMCSKDQQAWILNSMPPAMEASIVKLMKCFKKYRALLEKFFSWRSDGDTKRSFMRGLMDKQQFVQLMKDACLYPQLFERRELEMAVEHSGSHHRTAQRDVHLNFPEFVEALVRCSLRLQWGDSVIPVDKEASSTSDPEDVTVVVKFLMLVFAIEGKGSMLNKRDQDMSVLLGYLEQQHAHKKADKMRRFHRLLRTGGSVNPTKRETPRYRESHRYPVARSQPALVGFVGGHWQSDDNTASAAEDCESPLLGDHDFKPPGQVGGHEFSTHGTEFGDDHDAKSDEYLQQVLAELSIPEDISVLADIQNDCQRDAHSIGLSPRAGLSSEQDGTKDRTVRGVVAGGTPAPDTSTRRDAGQGSRLQDKSEDDGDKPMEHDYLVDMDMQSYREPKKPMPANAFLDEILSSIGDVELLLQQSESEPRRPSRSVSTSVDRATLQANAGVSLSGHLGISSLLMREPLSREGHTIEDSGVVTDDIQVYDPMLDYLTQVDRFSESPDWQSRLSISDVAEHGIHAVFPSSMYNIGAVQDSDLNDLTDPSRARVFAGSDDTTASTQ